MFSDPQAQARIASLARDAGLERVHIVAWRDLADVEAGGSEVHAHEVARRWAAAGVDVMMRTSYAQGAPPRVVRDGYRVVRKAGRYLVFPRAAWSELTERHGAWDGLVEIWNGMPFLSPLWRRGRPGIVFLHHVHADMWRMVMPENPRLARAGELVESRLAPLFYRRTGIVTLSESSKREIVQDMGLAAERIRVVPPGIDERFSPGGERSEHPLVVAVGRLVPVKRYDVLIRAMGAVHERVPDAELCIIGEGYERDALEQLIRSLGAEEYVRLAGHLSDAEVVEAYRRAWVVASASSREGWGMSVTEAAACGTPAVVTRIAGHVDAVDEGESGLLADGGPQLADHLAEVLTDDVLRKQLAEGALARAARFTWDATAVGAMEALAAAASNRR